MICNNRLFFTILYLGSMVLQAQQIASDSIQKLDEVVLHADRLLQSFSKTQTTQTLTDSDITRNGASLTQVLSFNSPIYFRENGLGMVSSPSFRGTNAQQTAVIWNGININSQLNGQTDFNTINTRNFSDITIRHGGGSVLYGSGAIGGSIHLNDKITFIKPFENTLFASVGSFNTKDISFKSSYGDEKFSIGFTVAYNHSDNDYTYEFNGRERTNLNGQFYKVAVSTNLGYKLNGKNTLRYYNYIFDGERHFALILPTEIPTKYRDFNTRQLLEWEGRYGKLLSVLRGAYLTESYKYFFNAENDNFSFGEVDSYIANYQLSYDWSNGMKLLGVADINHSVGKGSNIEEVSRTISAFSVLLNQRVKSFYYEASLRKEITNTYESPLLFSVGLKNKFSDAYRLSINGSKNFRIPTYNDLYWEGQGNPDLNPETSYQLEIGNRFIFGKWQLNLTGFYNDIQDMIRWLPQSDGIWRPTNTDEVVSYGLESQLNYKREFGNHQLDISANYAYTISENTETDKQLIYVPFHKGAGALNYAYKTFSAYWQTVYAGEVFTQSDNNPNRIVDSYWVHNFGAEYKGIKALTIGFRLQNVLDTNYQSVANRYMPGINTNIYLNFNF